MQLRAVSLIDFYKVGHYFQYPKGLRQVYSNFTPRSNKHAPLVGDFADGHLVNVGVQGTIKLINELWQKTFFDVPEDIAVGQYERRCRNALGAPQHVEHIRALHQLGYLPIEIRALAEGTIIPMRVPMFTINNTHEDFGWVTNFLEDLISSLTWKVATVATISAHFRQILTYYVSSTGGAQDMIPWLGHDFSLRGMSTPWDASFAGLGHLASFYGTDNVPSIDFAEIYYNANSDKELVGGSVPASEHSSSTANIFFEVNSPDLELNRRELRDRLQLSNEFSQAIIDEAVANDKLVGEYAFLKRYITEVYPSGIVSYVSDTFDFFGVITILAVALKKEILGREGKLVFRPDSGDPANILCGEALAVDTMKFHELRNAYQRGFRVVKYAGGYWNVKAVNTREQYEVDRIPDEQVTNEQRGAVELLGHYFGTSKNAKGFLSLNAKVGLIYGDSITPARMDDILGRLMIAGYACDGVVFGIGSYTYQYLTRDTFGMAMKATVVQVNDDTIELVKDPKTGDGLKKSATGYLRVEIENGEYKLHDRQPSSEGGELKLIYRDGKLLEETSLSQIRMKLWGWSDLLNV